MLVRMTHVGGPLDGTIEFEDGDEGNLNAPNIDLTEQMARGTYLFTEGEVGKGALAVGPGIIEALRRRDVARKDLKGTTVHKYFITSNDIVDGVKVVVAEHRPEYRPAK